MRKSVSQPFPSIWKGKRTWAVPLAGACILIAAAAFYYPHPKATAPSASVPRVPPVPVLSDAAQKQLRGTPVGIVRQITDDSLMLEMEDFASSGKLVISDMNIELGTSTSVVIAGKAKDPAVYKAEVAAYQEKVKAGAIGLEEPFPSERKDGTLKDVKTGEHVSIVLIDPNVPTPVAKEITVAYVPELPAAPLMQVAPTTKR